MIMLSVISLVSCNKDDNDLDNSAIKSTLIGVWAEFPDFDFEENFVYEFRTDGTYYSYVYDYKKQVEKTPTGPKWHINGNKVTVSYQGQSASFTIKSISSTTLKSDDIIQGGAILTKTHLP